MKQILNIILICCLVVGLSISCEIDNYEIPRETIKGSIVNGETGERVLTDQGNEGTRIRMRELSWSETSEPDNFDFYCMKEGVFQNTKVFEGRYNIRADGAFIPLLRMNTAGDTIADETKYVDVKGGVTEVVFEVQPFLNVEWVGDPVVNNGQISVNVKITRAISPSDFKAKIEPMGNFSEDMLNITDIRLFVSQVPFVGYREWDNRYSAQINYEGNSFDSLLGQTITLTTNGTIDPGRTVFIRAAARINFATANIKRHNYNEALRVDIPR